MNLFTDVRNGLPSEIRKELMRLCGEAHATGRPQVWHVSGPEGRSFQVIILESVDRGSQNAPNRFPTSTAHDDPTSP